MADGFIAGFEAKYRFRFWRPVSAIHEAATDDNPFTKADPTWQPFLITPVRRRPADGNTTARLPLFARVLRPRLSVPELGHYGRRVLEFLQHRHFAIPHGE